MAGDPSIYQGCGCASADCAFYGCRIQRDRALNVPTPQTDFYREGLNRFFNRASPEIDLERLADLIVERLQRPKTYQG